jgi:hypothetical protein
VVNRHNDAGRGQRREQPSHIALDDTAIDFGERAVQHRYGFKLIDAFAQQIPQAGSNGVEMMDGGISPLWPSRSLRWRKIPCLLRRRPGAWARLTSPTRR